MSDERRYQRFSVAQRIEHWVAMGSFTILALTGLVQKFAEAQISVTIIDLLGGIEATRIIHRGAAIILMLEVVYHLGSVGYKFLVQRSSLPMLPSLEDIQNAWQTLKYYFGGAKNKPQQGRFTFEEKAEYWAFVWGTIIMAITGFMLWNPIATTRFLPGEFIPAAKAAHGNEALLAVLAIILWHFYHVHIRTFNRSMFTGKMSEHEMLDEHPKELADIKAGRARRDLDESAVQRRRMIFLPVYGVIALALVFGIYQFATFEETAIETVPTQEGEVAVYVPFTPTPPPTEGPTEAPTEGAVPTTWEQGIGDLFQQRCAGCHTGDSASGGLDVTTYQSTLEGGTSGPGVVPGDLDASLAIQRQISGGHPGEFTDLEIGWVIDWVEAGAPEN
ncbi:MAG: cytochrome b/b6 domain-containing protein [Anaerolineales bacterium]